MVNYFDFSNRVYLITGASSGLGLSVAQILADCGAQLFLTARDHDRLNKARDTLSGEHHEIFAKDLMEPDYSDLFEYVHTTGKRLDGVVHCAGISPVLPISSLTRARVDECMSANFYSLIELMRLYSKKKYRAEKGSVVTVSSISTLYPEKCQTIYAASKAAMNAAVQGMALEFAKYNVRINAVAPGSMDTEMTRKAIAEGRIDNLDRKLSKQLLGLTAPEDVAKVIAFLLSDMSTAITGRLIYADGGYINI